MTHLWLCVLCLSFQCGCELRRSQLHSPGRITGAPPDAEADVSRLCGEGARPNRCTARQKPLVSSQAGEEPFSSQLFRPPVKPDVLRVVSGSVKLWCWLIFYIYFTCRLRSWERWAWWLWRCRRASEELEWTILPTAWLLRSSAEAVPPLGSSLVSIMWVRAAAEDLPVDPHSLVV